MLNKTGLIEHISATIGKGKVVELFGILIDNRFDVKDLIELTLLTEKDIAFRASWMLENFLITKPECFVNHLQMMLDQFLIVKNSSCQRHYAKIVVYLTSVKVDEVLKPNLAAIDMETVITRCFDLIIDPKTPVAVSVHCSQALFNLRWRYDWISETLTDQIKLMMDNGGPAIKARGRKLLNLLENN